MSPLSASFGFFPQTANPWDFPGNNNVKCYYTLAALKLFDWPA